MHIGLRFRDFPDRYILVTCTFEQFFHGIKGLYHPEKIIHGFYQFFPSILL